MSQDNLVKFRCVVSIIQIIKCYTNIPFTFVSSTCCCIAQHVEPMLKAWRLSIRLSVTLMDCNKLAYRQTDTQTRHAHSNTLLPYKWQAVKPQTMCMWKPAADGGSVAGRRVNQYNCDHSWRHDVHRDHHWRSSCHQPVLHSRSVSLQPHSSYREQINDPCSSRKQSIMQLNWPTYIGCVCLLLG